MQEITFQGTRIQLDPQLTRSLRLHSCQCDQCSFSDIGRAWFAPTDQNDRLKQLGANPTNPVLQWPVYSPKRQSRSHWCIHAIWVIRGRLIEAQSTPLLSLDRLSSMWITSYDQQKEAMSSELEDVKQKHNDILYVHAINRIPWIPLQLASHRVRMAEKCDQCGRSTRLTGYLKRKSLIPEWCGAQDALRALQDHSIRVYGEFCSCGSVHFTEVPRKRPYYCRDLIYKAWLKDLHAKHSIMNS